jgi:hypothetical protein
MKKKFVSFVAVACMAGAVAAGPAQASSTAPSFQIPDLSGLCKSVKQPSLQAACNQGVTIVQTCSKQTTTNGVVSCLSNAARQFNISKVKLPAELSGLLAGFLGSGGSTGGIKLPNLGGIKLPNLGGIKLPGGIDLSKLLAGLKG